MNDVSPGFALLLGAVIGVLLYGPIQRWVLTFRRTLRERAAQGAGQRPASKALLLIFATLHPAPWLLIIGLPYAVYRLWYDPLRVTWACLLAGGVAGALLVAAFEAWTRTRSRAPARAPHD